MRSTKLSVHAVLQKDQSPAKSVEANSVTLRHLKEKEVQAITYEHTRRIRLKRANNKRNSAAKSVPEAVFHLPFYMVAFLIVSIFPRPFRLGCKTAAVVNAVCLMYDTSQWSSCQTRATEYRSQPRKGMFKSVTTFTCTRYSAKLFIWLASF